MLFRCRSQGTARKLNGPRRERETRRITGQSGISTRERRVEAVQEKGRGSSKEDYRLIADGGRLWYGQNKERFGGLKREWYEGLPRIS